MLVFGSVRVFWGGFVRGTRRAFIFWGFGAFCGRRPIEVQVRRVSPPGENVAYICGSESERSVVLVSAWRAFAECPSAQDRARRERGRRISARGGRFLFRERKEELSLCRGCTLAFPVARCEIEC